MDTSFIIIIVVFFVGMMLLSILPQKKRQKKMAEMMNSLSVGTKIKTIGGFVGVIVRINDDQTMDIDIGVEVPVLVNIVKQGVYANLDIVPQGGYQNNTGSNDNTEDKPSI